MVGGLPGSRAVTPSCPFGTATPPTITVPGGEHSASVTPVSPEVSSWDKFPLATLSAAFEGRREDEGKGGRRDGGHLG